jgi:hypothetical protein
MLLDSNDDEKHYDVGKVFTELSSSVVSSSSSHHQSSVNLVNEHQNNSFNHQYVYLFFVFSYTLITVLSLGGNLLILMVILKRRMRVVTNFFLANITIANLIYTICSPLHFIAEVNISN